MKIMYVLRMLINLVKENGFTLKKAKSRWCRTEIIADADYVDDITLFANTPTPTESLYETDSGMRWPPHECGQNGVYVF